MSNPESGFYDGLTQKELEKDMDALKKSLAEDWAERGVPSNHIEVLFPTIFARFPTHLRSGTFSSKLDNWNDVVSCFKDYGWDLLLETQVSELSTNASRHKTEKIVQRLRPYGVTNQELPDFIQKVVVKYLCSGKKGSHFTKWEQFWACLYAIARNARIDELRKGAGHHLPDQLQKVIDAVKRSKRLSQLIRSHYKEICNSDDKHEKANDIIAAVDGSDDRSNYDATLLDSDIPGIERHDLPLKRFWYKCVILWACLPAAYSEREKVRIKECQQSDPEG